MELLSAILSFIISFLSGFITTALIFGVLYYLFNRYDFRSKLNVFRFWDWCSKKGKEHSNKQ